jgi:hypothetical protein
LQKGEEATQVVLKLLLGANRFVVHVTELVVQVVEKLAQGFVASALARRIQ